MGRYFKMVIKEILTPDIAITWLPWAVQYFFMIALAYGTVWVATTEILFNQGKNKRLLLLSALLMISAAIVAPISLLSDLHQPARAWHFYAQLRLSSWMWFGAFLLPIFNVLAIVLGWLLLRDALKEQGKGNDWFAKYCRFLAFGQWHSNRLIKIVAVIAFLFSLTIALYTGMEVMVVKARVLWNTGWLPFSLASTGALSAAGTLIVLNHFVNGYDSKTTTTLLKWCSWTLKIFVLIAAAWILTGSASANEAARLMEFSPTWQLAAIWVAVCIVVLMALLLKSKNASKLSLLFTGFLAIHLAWGIRWIILIQSQVAPKYGAGTYFYEISWGPDGILGIVGTFGLWIAIILFLSEILRVNQSPMIKGA